MTIINGISLGPCLCSSPNSLYALALFRRKSTNKQNKFSDFKLVQDLYELVGGWLVGCLVPAIQLCLGYIYTYSTNKGEIALAGEATVEAEQYHTGVSEYAPYDDHVVQIGTGHFYVSVYRWDGNEKG